MSPGATNELIVALPNASYVQIYNYYYIHTYYVRGRGIVEGKKKSSFSAFFSFPASRRC